MTYQYLTVGRASDLPPGKDRYLYRFFEMIPGLLSWSTLLAVVVFSFIFPAETALFIIVFDVYWLVKTVYLSLHLRFGYSQTKKNMKINWMEKLQVSGLPFEDVYHLVMLPMYQEPYE